MGSSTTGIVGTPASASASASALAAVGAATGRTTASLGARAARSLGLIFTVSTLVTLVLPNLARLPQFAPVGVILLAIAVCFLQLARSRSLFWPAAAYLLSLAALGTFLLPGSSVDDLSTLAVMTNIATVVVPPLCLRLFDTRALPVIILLVYIPVLALATAAAWSSPRVILVIAALAGYWIVFLLVATWLTTSSRRASAGIARLARAHVVERRSSEAEARRRYGSRLLHDTVLATLTLLAHSGAGVDPVALRARAREDSVLLRRLRVEVDTAPVVPTGERERERDRSASAEPFRADLTASAIPEPDPGPWSLASLGRRHGQSGLRITWHGDDLAGPPSPGSQALLQAISECLENVRRHSGAGEADVTITETDGTLRAAVIDTGVGFDLSAVPADRLGLAQSVRARLSALNGSVRVFSSPGAGTTVVLEVPR